MEMQPVAENIVRVTDFGREVIDRSRTVPVVVDFHADWCGPCKILGPVLERLAAEAAGRWLLATVDTEAHQRVAIDWGVQSIPNVKLFVDGAVVDEFIGALPEHAVRQWLARAIPSSGAKTIASAREMIARGDLAGAEAIARPLVEAEEELPASLIVLARSILLREPETAAELVRGLEEPLYAEEIETIETFVRLKSIASGAIVLPDGPCRGAYLEGVRATVAGEHDRALGLFIGVIRDDRYYDDDGARKACLAIFRILGEDDEITLRHRREFGSALYV